MIGLLVSPGVGLIFFFPIAVLLPLGAKYMYKDNRALFLLCIYIIIANWIYIGTLSSSTNLHLWSGGIAWGPRYLIPDNVIYHDSPRKYIHAFKEKEGLEGNSDKLVLSGLLH